jgi:hypothetical protein
MAAGTVRVEEDDPIEYYYLNSVCRLKSRVNTVSVRTLQLQNFAH